MGPALKTIYTPLSIKEGDSIAMMQNPLTNVVNRKWQDCKKITAGNF